MIARSFLVAICFVLLLSTWGVRVYHLAVFPPPHTEKLDGKAAQSEWIDKRMLGVHQLVVSGSAYARGLAEGRHTKSLIFLEEKALIKRFNQFLPNVFVRQAFQVLTFRWFLGIDKFFSPWMVEEMAGIAESASHQFDYLADPLTRQVAYHGVHEVGQMMVDQTGDDRGCTAFAIPYGTHWIIGRNFDFEGPRILDSEKIMKWVFPDKGVPFVSVTWAGMVGVVTGVNQRGVYISLNAAGTTDFARYGTPSTLVVLKALQFSQSAEQAVRVIAQAKVLISDIYLVADEKKVYRMEKSPRAIEVIQLEEASVITNHFLSPRWRKDRINLFRRDALTSARREERGHKRLAHLDQHLQDPRVMELITLSLLRDKAQSEGGAIQLGHRAAIDALIATHSVIYNPSQRILYVSQGPGVAGAFSGFDLALSFAARKPKFFQALPADPLVNDKTFSNVRTYHRKITRASEFAQKRKCREGHSLIQSVPQKHTNSYAYFSALGDVMDCMGKRTQAAHAWRKALSLKPAYRREREALKKKLADAQI